jgi:uncharacterized DUF497 family protein
MDLLRFDWNAQKGAANLKKHGIGFEEARSVFYDELARLIDDPDHSQSEDRFVLLGMSARFRILVRLPLLSRRTRRHQDHLGPQGHGRGGKFLSVKVTYAQTI